MCANKELSFFSPSCFIISSVTEHREVLSMAHKSAQRHKYKPVFAKLLAIITSALLS